MSSYLIVGVVAAAAGIVGFMVALALPELGRSASAIAVGVASCLCTWSLTGTVSLVQLTMFHAEERARLMAGADEASHALSQRRSPRRAS